MSFKSFSNKFIEVEPKEAIIFDNNPKRSSISSVKITNVFPGQVLFKIKTTAPKSYVVRPNQVVLSPGETLEVQIYMNPTDGYPSVSNSKDRFKIVAIDVPDNIRASSLGNIWEEKTEALQEIKLKADFRPAAQPITNSTILNAHRNQDQPPTSKLNYSQESGLDIQGTVSDTSHLLGRRYSSNIKTPALDQQPDYLSNNYGYKGDHNNIQPSQFKPLTAATNGNAAEVNERSTTSDPGVDFKKKYEQLLTKVEEQEKQLTTSNLEKLKVSDERNRVYNDLQILKENLSKRKAPEKSNGPGDNIAEFQFIHVVLVAVISLLLGAFFSV